MLGMQCRYISLSTALRQVKLPTSLGVLSPKRHHKGSIKNLLWDQLLCSLCFCGYLNQISKGCRGSRDTQYIFPVLMYHLQWCSVPVDAKPGAEPRLYYEFCLAFASAESGLGALVMHLRTVWIWDHASMLSGDRFVHPGCVCGSSRPFITEIRAVELGRGKVGLRRLVPSSDAVACTYVI